ncbi:MAG: VCBS repeat-containing protein [Verrucomicrobia bacterium]|nr:VCBS repeat-containing protein [Verrucomicrobiota bacterium]
MIAPSAVGRTRHPAAHGLEAPAPARLPGQGLPSPGVFRRPSANRVPYRTAVSDLGLAALSVVMILGPCSLHGQAGPVSVPPGERTNIVGAGPNSVVAADFNSDGKPDLATANVYSDSASVLLGKGDGTFLPHLILPVGGSLASGPSSLVAADFNRDGRADLAVANEWDDSVSVFLGNGNGTFQAELSFDVGEGPVSVAAGDFNGDGKPDLATANENSYNVSVLLGNGAGGFQPQIVISASLSDVACILTGDFDGNGRSDFACVDSGHYVMKIWLSNGDGTFVLSDSPSVGSGGGVAAAGDFNRDGKLDLACPNGSSDSITVLLGNGDGTFRTETRVAAVDGPAAVVAMDFNADGHPDLAACNNVSGEISVLPGLGDGTFPTRLRFPSGGDPSSLAAADFDGDGKVDLAAPAYDSSRVCVLRGNGDGTFRTRDRFVVGDLPLSLAHADFNRDGKTDLATANALSDDVSVLLAYGDGSFQKEKRFMVGKHPVCLVAGDFNADGKPDLATGNSVTGDVSLLMGNGDGSFQTEQRFTPGGSQLRALAIADFNGDGMLDIVSTTRYLLLGNGDGTFRAPRFVGTTEETTVPDSIAAGDIDRDGSMDIAITYGSSDRVAVILGNGNGTFQFERIVTVGRFPEMATLDDLNADGMPDLVVCNYSDVSVLLGNGDGTFLPETRYPVISSAVGHCVGDVDGDGKPDILAAGGESDKYSVLYGSFSLLLGNGDGTFRPEVRHQVDSGAYDVALLDLDGDQCLDVVTTESSHDVVAVWLGRRGAGLQIPQNFLVRGGPMAVAIADFNGDGKPDLTSAKFGSDKISVLPGSGTGSFALTLGSFGMELEASAGDGPISIGTADFNADDRIDVVTANRNSDDLSVLLGKGDGTFLAQQRLAVGEGPACVATGDFNRDGKPDIVSVDEYSDQVSVRLGNGDGTFQALRTFSTHWSPTSVAVGDWNRDGKPDLATSDSSSRVITILLGNGDGTFQARVPYTLGHSPAWIASGDFNGDGKPDLATCSSLSNNVSVHLGNGNGSFQTGRLFPAGSDAEFMLAADLDWDGRVDLATANQYCDDVAVLFGKGDGTFHPERRFGLRGSPVALAAGDLNADGRMDLVTANGYGDDLSILLGVPLGSVPEITVEQPAGTNLTDGGLKDFGSLSVGASSSLTFTVKNTGSATLTGLALTKNGTHDADFVLGTPGATTLAAGGSTTFTVAFSPTVIGTRTAAIHIASNDADENPFGIMLTGTGVDPDQSVAAAIELSSKAITDGGQSPWFRQSTTTHDGIDAAQSGPISDDQSSSISLTATGSGTVSFWWKVSSEEDFDFLSFYIDGVIQDSISGEVGWQQKSYPLTAGSHTLRWTYSKEELFSDGSDCGWVDQVVLPASSTPQETWRQTYFSTTSNTGTAADMADPDKDGVVNLLEYAFGLHPLQNSAHLVPKFQRSGSNLTVTFTQPVGITGITYGAEWSPTMAAGSWLPITDTGTAPQHMFTVSLSGSQKFVRLKVIAP